MCALGETCFEFATVSMIFLLNFGIILDSGGGGGVVVLFCFFLFSFFCVIFGGLFVVFFVLLVLWFFVCLLKNKCYFRWTLNERGRSAISNYIIQINIHVFVLKKVVDLQNIIIQQNISLYHLPQDYCCDILFLPVYMFRLLFSWQTSNICICFYAHVSAFVLHIFLYIARCVSFKFWQFKIG